jgi:hypothetical protein
MSTSSEPGPLPEDEGQPSDNNSGKGENHKLRSVRLGADGVPRHDTGRLVDLPLSAIAEETDLQQRTGMSLNIVDEYADAMKRGDQFPPVIAYFDTIVHWLADGHFRSRAARKAGLTTIRALVYEGSREDAMIYALGANEEHGFRRTRNDRLKAVRTMLNHDLWCEWTDAAIAAICHVSKNFVSEVRHDSPDVKGHHVQARFTSDGRLVVVPKVKLPPGANPKTFEPPPERLTRAQMTERHQKKLKKRLQQTDGDVQMNVDTPFGPIEIVTPVALYTLVKINDRQDLYSTVGRMQVSRAYLKTKARIVLVGYFRSCVAEITGILRDDLDIRCVNPEEIYRGEW